MRRGGVFWGVLLMAVGGLFLLDTTGLLAINTWQLILPVLLVLLGLWVLLGQFGAPGAFSSEGGSVNIPLEGAERVRVRLRHGMGPAGRARGGPGGPVGRWRLWRGR